MVRESFSTGKTTPSEVATSTIATNSGEPHKPPAPKGDPDKDGEDNGPRNPGRRAGKDGAGKAADANFQAEENHRKASPTSARIETGASGFAQPSPEGPITMPSRISSTIAGSRTRGKKPSAKGASRPAATTMSRLMNMGHRFQWPGVTRLVCEAR